MLNDTPKNHTLKKTTVPPKQAKPPSQNSLQIQSKPYHDILRLGGKQILGHEIKVLKLGDLFR